MRNIGWLAGRGYSMLGVSWPATYQGKQDIAKGMYLSVLWENMTEPILSGREDVGYSKIYAELPAPMTVGDETRCQASWDGFRFFEMKFTDIKPLTDEEKAEDAARSVESQGLLHYKYMQRTGVWTEADDAYPALGPKAQPGVKVLSAHSAKATMKFHATTWEDMPTQFQVVNGLASLPVHEVFAARVIQQTGSDDMYVQRILR